MERVESGLRPGVAAAVVLCLLGLVLGAGFVLARQVTEHQALPATSTGVRTAPTRADQATPPARVAPTPAPGATTASAPRAGTAQPAATLATPPPTVDAVVPVADRGSADDATAVVGHPSIGLVGDAGGASGATTEDGGSAPDRVETANTIPDVSASSLPVALPSVVALDGADVPVGPGGVQTAGARAFAQVLLVRAQDRDPGLAEDPALRQIAEDALMDELASAQLTGLPRPVRLRRSAALVQIDVVGALPDTSSSALQLFPSTIVSFVGVAVGVAQRTESGYLPDLVTVAAVAYR